MAGKKRSTRPIDLIKRTVLRRPMPKLTAEKLLALERKKIQAQRAPNKNKVLAVSERMLRQSTIVVNSINIPKVLPSNLLKEILNPHSEKMEHDWPVHSGEFILKGLQLDVMVAPATAVARAGIKIPKNIEIVPNKPLVFILIKKIKRTAKGSFIGLKGVNAFYDLEGRLLGYMEPPVN